MVRLEAETEEILKLASHSKGLVLWMNLLLF